MPGRCNTAATASTCQFLCDQDVIRVSHRDDVEDLRRKGRDLEVTVLARAVRAHVSHRVLVYGRRTVVFD